MNDRLSNVERELVAMREMMSNLRNDVSALSTRLSKMTDSNRQAKTSQADEKFLMLEGDLDPDIK